MPLVNIMIPGKKETKCVIKASSIAEVIQKAIEKLELPDQTYKIFLEDGSQILDDEVFVKLDKHTQLIISKEGMSYTDPAGEIVQGKTIQSTAQTENSENNLIASSDELVMKPSYLTYLLPKISESLKKLCEQGENLDTLQLTDFVADVRRFMTEDLKDMTRNTAKTIAQEICEKYPETFSIEITGGCSLSLEVSLFVKLYDAVLYYKNKHSKASSRKRRSELLGLDDSEISKKKIQKQGEYGCAPGQYCPALPSNEEIDAMTDKCDELVKYYEAGVKADDQKIKNLIEETYVLQRNDIVYSYPCLDDRFFLKWPYFKNYQILLQHAEKLIGVKSLEHKWVTALGQYAKPIRSYLKNEEVVKVHKKKGQVDEFVKNNIKEAKNYSENLNQSEIPLVSVIFSLIIHYFEEEQNLLYIVVDDGLVDEKQIADAVPNITPTLVVKGQSLWDEKATFYVVMNKKSLVLVNGLYNGLLLTFLYYFIYSLCYPQKLSRTLEFIQRFFLSMNPPKGTKKDPKIRQTNTVQPKVQKLMKDLMEYINKQKRT